MANIKPIIILDNGHGNNTSGKRSPKWSDGSQLFEWEFNRNIVNRIQRKLLDLKILHTILVPQIHDVSLTERCKRANRIHEQHHNRSILISIHSNAGGGTGFEVWTSPGQTASDKYATILFDQFKQDFPEWKMRADYSDGDPDKESAFTILSKTIGPALLSESFFMDTEKDCRFIMSEEGGERIAASHVKAIQKMIEL